MCVEDRVKSVVSQYAIKSCFYPVGQFRIFRRNEKTGDLQLLILFGFTAYLVLPLTPPGSN